MLITFPLWAGQAGTKQMYILNYSNKYSIKIDRHPAIPPKTGTQLTVDPTNIGIRALGKNGTPIDIPSKTKGQKTSIMEYSQKDLSKNVLLIDAGKTFFVGTRYGFNMPSVATQTIKVLPLAEQEARKALPKFFDAKKIDTPHFIAENDLLAVSKEIRYQV